MDPEEQRQLLDQLNQNMLKMNELLATNNLLQAKAQGFTSRELKEFNNDIRNASGAMENFDKGLQARLKVEEENARLTAQYNMGIRSGIGAVTGLVSAMRAAEDGLDKYEGMIGQATDAIGSFAKMIPGIAGTIAEGAVQAAGTILQMTLQKYSQVIKAFDTLTPLGVTAGLAAGQIDAIGRSAGFAGTRLEIFAKGAAEAGEGLQAIGGTASSGLKVFGAMAAIGDDQLRVYRRLGFSQNQLLEFQATYVRQLQQGSVVVDKRAGSELRLQKSSLELLDQMTALADLTGINVKEQQKARDFANAQYNFSVYTARRTAEAAELRAKGENEAADKILKEQEKYRLAIGVTLQRQGQDAATQLAELLASGGILTESSSRFALQYNQIEGGFRTVLGSLQDSTKTTTESLAEFLGYQDEATQKNLQTFGDLAQGFGKIGEDIGKTFGLTKEAVDSFASSFRAGLSPEDNRRARQLQLEKILEEQNIRKNSADQYADTIATVEQAERKVREQLDNLVLSLNLLNPAMDILSKVVPLITEENIKLIGKMALVAGAATLAATALGKLALSSVMGGGGGGIFSLPGGRGPNIPGGGGRTSTILGPDGNPIDIPAAKPTVGGRIAGSFNPANLVRGLGFGAVAGAGTDLLADLLGRDTGLGQAVGIGGSAASGAMMLSMFGLPGMAAGALGGGLFGLLRNMNGNTAAPSSAIPGLPPGVGGITVPEPSGMSGSYDPLAGLLAANNALLTVSQAKPLPVRLPDQQIAGIGTAGNEELRDLLDVNKDGVVDELEKLQGIFKQQGFGTYSPGVFGTQQPGSSVIEAKIPQDVTTNLNTVAAALKARGINDEKYITSALSNVLKESGGISRTEQSYAGTSNERIRGIFGSTQSLSEGQLNTLKANPEQFFNYVYGSGQKAKTLGNTEPGDGFKFRGRGYIQLTGRDNYARASKALYNDDRLVQNPDLVNDPKVAADVAAWWFEKDRVRMAQNIFGAGVDVNKLTQQQTDILATSQVAGTDVSKTQNQLLRQGLANVSGFSMNQAVLTAARNANVANAPDSSKVVAATPATTAPTTIDPLKAQVLSAQSAEAVQARMTSNVMSKEDFFKENVVGRVTTGSRGRGTTTRDVVRTQDQLETMYADYVKKQQEAELTSASAMLGRMLDPTGSGTRADRISAADEKALLNKDTRGGTQAVASRASLIEMYNEATLQNKLEVKLQIENILRQRGELDKETKQTLTDINKTVAQYNAAMRPVLKAEEKRLALAQKEAAEANRANFAIAGKIPDANAAPTVASISTAPPVVASAPAASPATTAAPSTAATGATSSSIFETVLGKSATPAVAATSTGSALPVEARPATSATETSMAGLTSSLDLAKTNVEKLGTSAFAASEKMTTLDKVLAGFSLKSNTSSILAGISPLKSEDTTFSNANIFAGSTVPKVSMDKIEVTNSSTNPLAVKDTSGVPITVVSEQLSNDLKQLVEFEKAGIENYKSLGSKLDSMIAKLDTLNGIQERIMKAS